ncbi:MAG TPA: hypothetical protein VKV96_08220 [Roseiarcus sp.]|nr:hypothetical protein [Roseiarcus sp.]
MNASEQARQRSTTLVLTFVIAVLALALAGKAAWYFGWNDAESSMAYDEKGPTPP